jgi:putative polyketide hydroxylase
VAAASPHSPIREALGIGLHGRGVFGHGIGVVFEADLGVDGYRLYYLQNPALPGAGGVLEGTDGPNRYLLNVGFVPDRDRVADFTPARWVELVRIATGVPDLEVKLVQGGDATTQVAAQVADRFSQGRVHLIGDAAHVMPPAGGMGGNTAVTDAYYLAWKLAMVLRGEAGPGLLDSHDPERRSYADILMEQQYTEFARRIWPQLDDGTLTALVEPISTLFFGYRHLSRAVVIEDADDREPLENPERPTGRPGSRAPHVRLGLAGAELSTRDLFGRRFVVLAGPAGADWVRAAGEAGATLGIELDVHRVNSPQGPDDMDGQFAARYGVGDSGAVLVRPDGFIAWRSPGAGAPGELERALRAVLDRAR